MVCMGRSTAPDARVSFPRRCDVCCKRRRWPFADPPRENTPPRPRRPWTLPVLQMPEAFRPSFAHSLRKFRLQNFIKCIVYLRSQPVPVRGAATNKDKDRCAPSTRLASAVMAAALLFAAPARAADLIVATDTAFVPFEFKQGDKYVGFDIDLWTPSPRISASPTSSSRWISTESSRPADQAGRCRACRHHDQGRAQEGGRLFGRLLRQRLLLMVPSSSDIKGRPT